MELRYPIFPVEEEHSLLAIGGKFSAVSFRIELDPLLILEFVCVLELHAADRTLLFLVEPVPQRYGLRHIVTQSHNVLVIR